MKCKAPIDPATGIALVGEALEAALRDPYSPRCGQEIEDGDVFCPSCGAMVEFVYSYSQMLDWNKQIEKLATKDTCGVEPCLFLERIPCSRWIRIGYAASTVFFTLLSIFFLVMICAGGTGHLMFGGFVFLIGAIGATFRSLFLTLGKDSARDMDRANKNEASALFNIGIRLYKNEITVTKEDEIVASGKSGAFAYFMQAAMAGNAKAMFNVAVCLEHGTGCESNCKRALAWYRKAAENGIVEASNRIARIKQEKAL